ncbi:ion transport protein [Nitzschia inconspicua]|uniref:Ion transport protein n=1 Tax=Nitzschia inconspicua TaxID=303405 RepID=A0A9K3L2A2_9STRA|nr:ion transport protein [Nitzschia inconspicua]
MADATPGTKSTRFKRRLGEGLTVELIFTPSDNTPNPIANDGHLWSGNETTSIGIDRPSVRQSPIDTEESDGLLLQIDLTNFTGRVSFRKIGTNEGEISGDDYSTTPPDIIECPPTFEEIHSTLTEQQQAQQPINFIQVDDSHFERLLSSSVMTDDAVMGDEFSGVSSPIRENSSIRLQPSFMPATTEVEGDLTVSTLSSNDLKAVGKAGAPLSAGKFPFLRNRVKPAKNPTSEDTKQNSVTNTISNALRYRRNKRMSMFTIMKRESVRSLPSSVLMNPTKEEKNGQTELHVLVSSTDLTLQSLEETIERFPESASTADDKLKVFEAVENLRDIVPSLLILPNDQLDQAIATPVIWFCMDRHTTSPFSVGMSSTDFQLQITTIIAVRQGLFLLNTDGVFPIALPQLSIVSVVFFGCFFQVIRIRCEAMALKQISTQVALRYCRDPWRIFYFVGVFAAIGASAQYKIRIDNGFYKDESNFDGDTPPFLMAIMIGMLWVSVLGFLKAVNESLATFILALTRIFFDIRFFCIVLLVFILMFGDMFHLLYLEDPALKAECNSNDPSDPASDFCSERLVYAMMIEDFNLADFQQSPAQTILWLVVTFVGFVVMMNTLIAVITRSYERSHNSSIILFRRARCEFVASNAAIEGFLRPEFFDRHANRNCDLSSILLASARWILLLTFFVTISISSLYLVQLLVEVIEAKNWIAAIAAVVFCLIMTFNIWSSFVFILMHFYAFAPESGQKKPETAFYPPTITS